MFNPNNLVITGGNFVSSLQPKYDLKELFRNIVVDAFHNSSTSYDLAKCYPGTREAIMKDLCDWVKKDDREHPIYHLYAPAGSGKTAIARTLADTFSREDDRSNQKSLLAAFFFLRTVEGRNNSRHFITTIAYQIAINLPSASHFICEAIDQDPSLLSRDLMYQMRVLILSPLRRACESASEDEKATWPKLIVLDGLDECSGKDAQVDILHVVSVLANCRPLPLAIFLSCRPEIHIRTAFQTGALKHLSQKTCLSNKYDSEEDIRFFLVSSFKSICEAHSGISQFPPDWPDKATIDTLVQKSSGHFVYASVVVNYVKVLDDDPRKRLGIVCGLAECNDDEKPFAQLDALYSHILNSIKPTHRDIVAAVFSCILARSEAPTTPLNPILILDQVGVKYGLASLVGILVDYFGYENRYVKFLHASFSDFLSDNDRSGKHYIAQNQAHATVSTHLLDHLMNKDDDPSPLINESLRLHLPLSAPTDALRRGLQSLMEPDRVTAIIKRYVQFNVTGDGWDGIVELSRILATSPFDDASSLSANFQQLVNSCISAEIRNYYEEPLNCFTALLLCGANVNYFLACNRQQRYMHRGPSQMENGSQELLLWPVLGIDGRSLEIDGDSLNFWNMWHQTAWLRDVDLRKSMRELIKDTSHGLSGKKYSRLCLKLLKAIQEDDSRQHVLIFELLEHIVMPLLAHAEPCQELVDSLTHFKCSWWWNDCIPTKRFHSDDIMEPLDSYLSRCTAYIGAK